MRVLFITTPYSVEEHPMPPLSLSYLASVLLAQGIEVEILDLLTSKASPAKIRRKLEQYQPGVVGTTCVTMSFPAAARILKVCKEFDPRIVTVIGGPHVSFAADDTFRRAPWIDVIVAGEGDMTVLELVSALDRRTDLAQVPGIFLHQDGRVIKTGPRPLIQKIDELPFPARHLLPLSRYRGFEAACSVITSRGCPYSCIFCSAPRMFGKKVRFRHPERVVDEIELIHRDLGFDRVNIVDDTFTLNHRHTKELCRELIRRNLPVEWNAYSRVDTLTGELLELMREAGCTFLVFGIESGSQEILDTIKKGITLEKVRSAAKLTSAAGIKSFASFILGLPGETPETAHRTRALARELFEGYGIQYGFHFLSPFPGTEVYDKADEFGVRILTRNWARYNANEPITETTPASLATVREIVAGYDRDIVLAWGSIREMAEAGDEACAQSLRVRQTSDFVWELLKGDLIESLGKTKGSTRPQEAEEKLVEVLSPKVGASPDVARREIGKLLQKGLLKSEPSDNGFTWRWA